MLFVSATVLCGNNRSFAQDVQENAMKAWNKAGGNFRDNLKSDERVVKHLSTSEIESCFDPAAYLKNIDYVFERAAI